MVLEGLVPHPAQRIALTAAHPKEIVEEYQPFQAGLEAVVLVVLEAMFPHLKSRGLPEGQAQITQLQVLLSLMRVVVVVAHGTARVERAAVAAQVLVEMLHQKQLVGQAQPILGLVVVDQQGHLHNQVE